MQLSDRPFSDPMTPVAGLASWGGNLGKEQRDLAGDRYLSDEEEKQEPWLPRPKSAALWSWRVV